MLVAGLDCSLSHQNRMQRGPLLQSYYPLGHLFRYRALLGGLAPAIWSRITGVEIMQLAKELQELNFALCLRSKKLHDI